MQAGEPLHHSSSRALQQVIGRNGAICLAACSGTTVQSRDLQCPDGFTPKTVGGAIATCWRDCPEPYQAGPPPDGSSTDPSWCLIDTTRCPEGWVPVGTDTPGDGAITCRKSCPAGYQYLQPRLARAGCYRTCIAPRADAVAVTVVVRLVRRTVLKCCAACPRGTLVSPTRPDQCVSVLLPSLTSARDCANRGFVAATIATFAPSVRQVAAPTCASGWAPFTVQGARRCYRCAPGGTVHQLPGGTLTCLCDGSCPPGYLWCPRFWCLKDDRYAHELVGRTDVKLCGLFLDGLKIQACVPLCNPVVAPPKLT